MPQFYINERLVPVARKEDVLIVHPHVQRTGGGTLRNQVFVPRFGKENIYARIFNPRAKRWSRLTGADLENYRVYTDLHNYTDIALNRPHVAVALVRDPVYRAASLYGFVKRTEGHRLHAMANRYEMEAFYPRASAQIPTYFRNVQCRRICGWGSARLALESIAARFIGFGFTNDLPQFVHALCEAFEWPAIDLKSRGDDAERYGPAVTPRFRAMVLADNREDQELFEVLSGGPPFRPAPTSLVRKARTWIVESRNLSLASLRRAIG